MNYSTSISKRNAKVVLGVLICIFILSQTVVVNPLPDSMDSQEESSPTDNSQHTSSISEAVPNSSIQFNLDFQSFLLVETTFDEDGEENYSISEELLRTSKKALKVLFSKIISPNAP